MTEERKRLKNGKVVNCSADEDRVKFGDDILAEEKIGGCV